MTMLSHNYAINIELVVGRVLGCERFGLGGIVNSDFIERGAYTAMACALSVLYVNADAETQNRIDQFLQDYIHYATWRLDAMIDESGSEDVEVMIERFRELVAKAS